MFKSSNPGGRWKTENYITDTIVKLLPRTLPATKKRISKFERTINQCNIYGLSPIFASNIK